MGQVLPCLPVQNIAFANFKSAPRILQSKLSYELKLDSLNDATLFAVLVYLPAVTHAHLAAVSQAFVQKRATLQRLLCARGLEAAPSLRVIHVAEAEIVTFSWRVGGKLVSGDAGWLTEFGSVKGDGAALDGFFKTDGSACDVWRRRWSLELVGLDGLLVVGIADERMQDNVFVGAPSRGNWMSWGWELHPSGQVEAVVADGMPEVLTGAGRACQQSRALDLQPSRDRRVVLCVHLDARRSTLELHAHIQPRSDWPWRWHMLGSIRTRAHDTAILGSLRPAVSVNIGACVRLLDGPGLV